LTGSIPPELSGLSNLSELSLGLNQLTGSIPPELSELSNLSHLDLCCNRLTGSIPPELSGLSNLGWLDLWGNQLSGDITPEIGYLHNLTYLRLSANQLTCCIPRILMDVEGDIDLPYCEEFLTGHHSDLDPELVAQCSNGVAVPYPENNPGLVRDCVALLETREVMPGVAQLGWRVDIPILGWRGVHLGGSLPRVRELDLPYTGLTSEELDEIGRPQLPRLGSMSFQ